MSGVSPEVERAIREAGMDGFMIQSREALAAYRDALRSGCRDYGCQACSLTWAYVAGSLAGCVEGLLGVVEAAQLPVGGRHEYREPGDG